MLEPQADNPALLLEHHRRQAALNHLAGDSAAAYWHGRRAQKAFAALKEAEQEDEVQPTSGQGRTITEWEAPA